ncbi:hypothetical protein KR009_001674 [Drosophila setifemur]|nr:hypothetical protein KR009_001674 [Drosophila setifemur]
MSNYNFNGFVPVKIYQSLSSLYMTCISKLPRNAPPPECDQSLAIEESIVEAIDETLSPKAYEMRQKEAQEILLRSQEHILQHMGLIDNSTDQTNSQSEDEDEDEFKDPIRLKSEILLNHYHQLYEVPKPTLMDALPMEQIKNFLRMLLSLCAVAASLYIMIEAGHRNYFLG